jgi:urease accessory protein
VTTSHAAGTARLQFTRNGPETVLTRAFATSPAKLITTKSRGTTCWVYLATLGGGLVGGDDIQLTVDVAAGARGLLTTQASTKVYRSLRPCRQMVEASVGDRGLLAVVPDPVVCFAGADFTQHQRYELHAGASLVAVDWTTSGRHATGERWVFSRYESRIDVRRDGQPVVFDAVILEPELDSIAARMSRFEVILTALITGPAVSTAAEAMLDRTSREQVKYGGDPVVAASRICDGGVLLRMAGTSVERLGRALRERIAFLSPLVGDDLWSRKW